MHTLRDQNYKKISPKLFLNPVIQQKVWLKTYYIMKSSHILNIYIIYLR